MARKRMKWTPRNVKGMITKLRKYLSNIEFPTIAGFCKGVGITRYQYKHLCQTFDDFTNEAENLKNTQQDLLIRNGLNSKYNAQFSMFMLKNVHGFKEVQDVNVRKEDKNEYLADIVSKAESVANRK